ncbi:MAG: hypothetical protein U1E86_28310, partial [Burkholderiaceae bacterium]
MRRAPQPLLAFTALACGAAVPAAAQVMDPLCKRGNRRASPGIKRHSPMRRRARRFASSRLDVAESAPSDGSGGASGAASGLISSGARDGLGAVRPRIASSASRAAANLAAAADSAVSIDSA